MVQHFDKLTMRMDASARKEIFNEFLQHPCFLTMQKIQRVRSNYAKKHPQHFESCEDPKIFR